MTEQEFSAACLDEGARLAKQLAGAMPCIEITVQASGILCSWPNDGGGIFVQAPAYRPDVAPMFPPLKRTIDALMECAPVAGRA